MSNLIMYRDFFSQLVEYTKKSLNENQILVGKFTNNLNIYILLWSIL